MKDFELEIKYYGDGLDEVHISAKRYDDWGTYINIKNIEDLTDAIKHYVNELLNEEKEN